MLQYAQVFNHLCLYAGHHADSDAKKQDRFRRGLNTKLKERLNLVRTNSFNELVNMAITQDDCISAHRAEKKRKPPRYRLVQNTVPRASQRNSPSGRWVFRPPQQQGAARPPIHQQQQSGPKPNVQQPSRPNDDNHCFTCGSPAHFARNCP